MSSDRQGETKKVGGKNDKVMYVETTSTLHAHALEHPLFFLSSSVLCFNFHNVLREQGGVKRWGCMYNGDEEELDTKEVRKKIT